VKLRKAVSEYSKKTIIHYLSSAPTRSSAPLREIHLDLQAVKPDIL